MLKNQIPIAFRLPQLIFFFLFISSSLNSQILSNQNILQSTLPTKALVDAKMSRLAELGWLNGQGNTSNKTTGIEQNCAGAIPVCSQSYTQTTSYTGSGSIQEINNGCMSGENNTVWYIFTAQSSGNFGFQITTIMDYDWSLFDITTIGCSGIPAATPLRCNFSATNGSTGMDGTGTNPSEGSGGSAFCTELAVLAGETYALVIDNWTGDANGYILNFTSGSGYTSITDETAPLITAITSSCINLNTLILDLSEDIQCSSIASDGSDFSISGAGNPAVLSASSANCSGLLTNQVEIVLDNNPQIVSGTYTLTINTGSDVNTLLDKCDIPLTAGTTVNFDYLAPISLTANLSTICTSGDAVSLTATGAPAGATYVLTPGGTSNATGVFNINPTATTIYTVSATVGACTQTATATITLLDNIIIFVNPINPTICSGTINLNATVTLNGVACTDCNYSWNGGSFTETNVASSTWTNRGAGAYTVTATTANGCSSENTGTTTVSLASAGAGASCDVFYVDNYNSTVSGGILKSDPTSLLDAIAKAICTNSVIKMKTGTYNISDKIDMNSFVTIEGGYNSDFTVKTSDMTAGNATTIVRSINADAADPTSRTAFNAIAGAENFRLQDLRIDFPTQSTSGISNYAVKLESGCKNFDIVRCYLNAGTGADGEVNYTDLFTEDFESTTLGALPTGWSQTNDLGSDEWHVVNTDTYYPGSYKMNNTQYVQMPGQSSDYQDDYLTTSAINASGYTTLVLDFDQMYQYDYWANDYGQCQIEVYDGSSWIQVYWNNNLQGSWGNPGTINQQSIDITSYANAALQVRFRYYDVSYSYHWSLDNIVIKGGTPSSAGDAYGVYSIAATGTQNVLGSYASATGGSGGNAYLHYDTGTGDKNYTSLSIENYPMITAENISCENSDIDFTTSDPNPNWTSLGSGSTAIVLNSATTISNNQYTGIGRKTIDFTGVTLAAGSALTIFSDDFDASPSLGWTTGAISGTLSWATGTPQGGNGDSWSGNVDPTTDNTSTNTDNKVYGQGLGSGSGNGIGGYNNYTNEWLKTPAINCTGYTNVQLDFWRWANFESSYDEAYVEVSNDNITWVNLGETQYPADNNWVQRTIDISATADNQVTVYVRWRFDSDGSVTYSGWNIDDVKVSGDISSSTIQAVTYPDFVNIIMAKPASGTVTGTSNVCPGAYNFASSEAGTPGFTYLWTVTDPSGETSTITSNSIAATDIDFTNSTAATITYTVLLDITSECCGPLTQITFSVDITPIPSAPAVVNASLTECESGSIDLEVGSPDSTFTYNWYDAATGGNLLGAGTPFALSPVPNGGGSYYVAATSSNSCISETRTLVTVAERNTEPTVTDGTYCSEGIIEVSVSPVSGATYNWYAAATAGSLLQSGFGTTYDVNVPAPAPNTVSVWTTATETGCAESDRVQVDASITASAATTTWTGAVSSNWFNPNNWSDCVPNCAVDAVVPNVGTAPIINFSDDVNGDGIARTKRITIQNNASLSFGENKSTLAICENMEQEGTLVMYDDNGTGNGTGTGTGRGKIIFNSSTTAQLYRRTATGSGDLHLIEMNNTFSTATLTIENNAGFQDMIFRTDGQLILNNGKIITQTFMVDMRNTDTTAVSGHSAESYVEGNLRRYVNNTGSYDFPVGEATKGYQNVAINFTANSIGYLTTRFDSWDIVSNPGAQGDSECGATMDMTSLDNGYWTTTAGANATTAVYDITLYNANYTNAATGWTVMKNSGAGWILDGTCDPSPITAVHRIGQTGFSFQATAQSSVSLPIELLSFSGKAIANYNLLNWSTVTEINNDYFDVQRASDGVNFTKVGTVNGAGNSNSTLNYSFTDHKPFDEISYYRLKQIDFNGTSTFTNTIAIKKSLEEGIVIFPNPTENLIKLNIFSNEANNYEIIINEVSKLVHKQFIAIEKGSQLIDLAIFEKLAKGVYFIKVLDQQGNILKIEKVVKH